MPNVVEDVIRGLADMGDAELNELHARVGDEYHSRRRAREVAHSVYQSGHMFGFLDMRREEPARTNPLVLVK